MTKKKEYERFRFNLSECKAEINVTGDPETEEYGVAFLNITLPDGRWIPFPMSYSARVPLFKDKKKA